MKLGLKFVWQPTPAKIKSIADAVLWGMGSGGLIAAFSGYHAAGMILAIIGTLAKCASNFFSEGN